MELTSPGLENELVRLEPISEIHRPLIFESDIEKSVWKWMPSLPGGTSLSNYFEAILAMQARGLSATFIIFRKLDDRFAGVTGFADINKVHRRVRNALTWHPPEIASEALYKAGQLAMIQRAYEWRAKRLEWQINPKNDFIVSNLATLQPTREALFRNFERTADGVWVDKEVFAMTRNEMADAISRLTTDLFSAPSSA